MSTHDDDLTVKILLYVGAAFAIAIAIAIAVGSIVVAIGVFVAVGVVADLICRPIYARNLEEYKKSTGNNLSKVAAINNFSVDCLYKYEYLEKFPIVIWDAVIPNNMMLEIYRMDYPSKDYDEANEDGVLVLSTKQEYCWPDKSDVQKFVDNVVYDRAALEGTHYYSAFIVGKETIVSVLPYSFLSTSLNTTKRVRNRLVTSQPILCEYDLTKYDQNIEDFEEIEDQRPAAMKKKDEILAALKIERENNAAIDQAISEINADPDLTEKEKAIAIEMLETSIG